MYVVCFFLVLHALFVLYFLGQAKVSLDKTDSELDHDDLDQTCANASFKVILEPLPGKLTVLQNIHGNDFSKLFDVIGPRNIQYFKKWGYGLVVSDCAATDRDTQWAKIPLIFQFFRRKKFRCVCVCVFMCGLCSMSETLHSSDCDWILFLDADIVMLDFSIRFESMLEYGKRFSHDVNVVLAQDGDSFLCNTGFMFVKQDPWANTFLKNVWRYGSYFGLKKQLFHEQGTIDLMRAGVSGVSSRVFVLESRLSPCLQRYSPPCFAAHFVGRHFKMERVKQLLKTL